MANTATTPKKETKATMAVAMKKKNPSISNKEIAETLGMADAYVSQTLSKARDAGDLPTKDIAKAAKTYRKSVKEQVVRTTSAPKAVVVTRSAKVSPAADTMTATAVLEARAQITCMVQRLGACNVKSIIADVIS